jgi:hypothetical protein
MLRVLCCHLRACRQAWRGDLQGRSASWGGRLLQECTNRERHTQSVNPARSACTNPRARSKPLSSGSLPQTGDGRACVLPHPHPHPHPKKQETAATMVGMVLGMGVTKLTAGSQAAAWAVFLLMTWLHM